MIETEETHDTEIPPDPSERAPEIPTVPECLMIIRGLAVPPTEPPSSERERRLLAAARKAPAHHVEALIMLLEGRGQ